MTRPVTLEAMIASAVTHYRGGRHTEADEACDRVLQRSPRNAPALQLKALLALLRNEPAEARVCR